MKAGSLFSGYGGLDLAVEAVFGADLAWYAEFDPAPSKIMARHWPDIPNHHDVTQIDWSNVEPVDIISGGSPCQDVSAAGRRAGMSDGTRSNLWVAMREAIATIKPTYVVWENVRGAHSAKAHSAMESEPGLLGTPGGTYLRATGRVLGDLSNLGYDAEWRTISASSVGAPHRRERVFVLARRRDATAEDALRRGARGRDDPPRQGQGGRQDSQTLIAGGAPGGTGTVEPVTLLPTPMTAYTSRTADQWRAQRPAGNGATRSRVGDLRIVVEELLPTVTTSDTNGVGVHGNGGLDLRTTVATTDFGTYAPAIRRWESVLRPSPSPTELSPIGKHRLSERFTEWMMGLPDGWICDTPGITRRDAIKAAGNGVVPQQALAALVDMRQHVPGRAP